VEESPYAYFVNALMSVISVGGRFMLFYEIGLDSDFEAEYAEYRVIIPRDGFAWLN